jgi:hypothetical protein
MNWEDKHIKKLFEQAPYKDIPTPTKQDWQTLQKKLKKNSDGMKNSRSIALLVLKYSAIVIIIIGLSGLGYYFMHSSKKTGVSKNQILVKANKPDTTEKKHISDNKPVLPVVKDSSINRSPQHEDSKLKMEKSSFFENLIAANYRNNNIEVASPLLNQQFSNRQKIVFKFSGDISTSLVIKIYNNKGKRIHTTNSFQNNIYTLDIKLSKGLYYWKLEENTNLLYTGKFIVK